MMPPGEGRRPRFSPLFTRVRGRGILRTSTPALRSSPKFAKGPRPTGGLVAYPAQLPAAGDPALRVWQSGGWDGGGVGGGGGGWCVWVGVFFFFLVGGGRWLV